jgi:hypothetical protein
MGSNKEGSEFERGESMEESEEEKKSSDVNNEITLEEPNI